jgi:hypothetical protein
VVKLHSSLNQVSQFGKLSQLLVKKIPRGEPTHQPDAAQVYKHRNLKLAYLLRAAAPPLSFNCMKNLVYILGLCQQDLGNCFLLNIQSKYIELKKVSYGGTPTQPLSVSKIC